MCQRIKKHKVQRKNSTTTAQLFLHSGCCSLSLYYAKLLWQISRLCSPALNCWSENSAGLLAQACAFDVNELITELCVQLPQTWHGWALLQGPYGHYRNWPAGMLNNPLACFTSASKLAAEISGASLTSRNTFLFFVLLNTKCGFQTI